MAEPKDPKFEDRLELPSLDVLDSQDAFNEMHGDADEVIQKHTKCPICSSNLHFSHIPDFSRNMTVETSNCPECKIKLKRVMHKLQ